MLTNLFFIFKIKMSYRRYVKDRTIDISKYPSYSKFNGGNIIKIPNYEKTSKTFNNLIPLSRFGVNPNDFNEEKEDMQKYGILELCRGRK